MPGKNRKYILILIISILVLIIVEYFAPKPLNWKLSFNQKDKNPFGCYVLYSTLEHQYGKNRLSINKKSYYELLNYQTDTNTQKKNILLVTYELKPDKYDLNKLLDFVKNGNCLFIAASSIDDQISDTLGFEISGSFRDSASLLFHTEGVNFVNSRLKSDSSYHFKKAFENTYFSKFNRNTSAVLGTNDKKQPDFIKIHFGNGNIYIDVVPMAFTNYALLYDNYEYAFKALSYLPDQPLIWDEYYKPGKQASSSMLRYILSEPALRAAYLVLIFTLLLYILFESRRQQRIIPVVKPLANTTLEFTETLSRLYLQKGNNKDISLKRFYYFKNFVRTRYFFTGTGETEEFYDKLAGKSGAEKKLIKKIFEQARAIEGLSQISDTLLIQFNKNLELFYQQVKSKI